MEPKPSPPAEPPPAAAAPRRRANPKRKTKAAKASSPSPPPKRQALERSPSDPHTGPLTRTPRQQSPLNPAREVDAPPQPAQLDVERDPPRAKEAARLPPVAQEIEAVLSRGAGVHVVPTFAGWFSWNEIHQIEKQALPSFFDGISERRTPDIYLGIRNSIMKKFHSNPQMHLEVKDLSKLSDGEMDARLEVLGFLSYWGLINFHPCQPTEQDVSMLIEGKTNSDTEEKVSLGEKLFQFETVQSYLIPVPNRAEVAAPTHTPSLLCETGLTDDLIIQAESSVEYHCNSCSVDCSRKRYHCRTQADFDLCCNCYDEGKLDVGMSRTDFIIMESAEAPTSGSTSWTDQETLLLLEALQMFEAKWGDIVEHVASKTRSQCMLHFLQMPILDSFLHDGDVNETSQETAEQISAEKGTSRVTVKMEANDKAEGKNTNDEKIATETKLNCAETGELHDNATNKHAKNSGAINLDACCNIGGLNISSDTEPTKKNISADIYSSRENTSNIINHILKSAFEVVGHIPKDEDLGSFAEAGNPVMTLAAFLADLVEHDDATTLCCCSFKAVSEMSPALQLAMRHCFILQDPPNDLEDPTVRVSPTKTGGEQQTNKDASSNPNVTDNNEKDESALSVVLQNTASTLSVDIKELSNAKESKDEPPEMEPKFSSAIDYDNPISHVAKGASANIRQGHGSTSHPVSLKNTNEPCSVSSQETSAKGTKYTSDSECVEGDELIYKDPPLQGKVKLNKMELEVPDPCNVQQHESSSERGNIQDPNSIKDIVADDVAIQRLQRAAATAISAAAVKAKFLAKQEEYQIQQLAALVIDKQFWKMQAKMSFFTEAENLVSRAREYTEKTRKKLLRERNALIAYRMAAMAPRPNQAGMPGIRLPVGYGVNQHMRRS